MKLLRVPTTPPLPEPAGYGNSKHVFSRTLRNFDAEFRAGTLNDADVEEHIRKTIASNFPYKPKVTTEIEIAGSFETILAGGEYKRLGEIMRYMVIQSSHDRLVRETSRAIVHAYRVPSKDWVNEAAAIQHFIIRYIHYEFDTGEQFTWPGRALVDWYQEKEGLDCDCMSILAASLLVSLGYTQVCIALVDSKFDGILRHACVCIKIPGKAHIFGADWVNMEFTRGKLQTTTPLGWFPTNPTYTKYVMVPVADR